MGTSAHKYMTFMIFKLYNQITKLRIHKNLHILYFWPNMDRIWRQLSFCKLWHKIKDVATLHSKKNVKLPHNYV